MAKIVYDPGHGGNDPGAIGPGGIMEKDVNLEIALRCRQYGVRLGHQVLLTRSDDSYVSLMDRVQAANNWYADVFVSVHCNSYSSPEANGTEVWCYNQVDQSREFAAGVALALCLSRYLKLTTNRSYRGVRFKSQESQEFVVLRYTTASAALVETAFISNHEEEQLLAKDWYLEKVSLGIVLGVQKFLEIPGVSQRQPELNHL